MCLFGLFVLLFVVASALDEIPMFFMYPWADDMVWTPPTKHDGVRRFTANAGLGELIDPKLGLYETAPYSLYAYMLARLAIHPQRTLDPAKATFFFIPLDITHNTWEGAKQSHTISGPSGGAAVLNPRAAFVIKELTASIHFQRNGGRDHVIVEGMSNPLPLPSSSSLFVVLVLVFSCKLASQVR
jgi:hypothetical protein